MAKGTLVVSLRSKGLASFNKQTFDFRHQAINFGIEAFDVVISYFLTLYHLSWSSWMSLIVCVLTISISMGSNTWLAQRRLQWSDDFASRVATTVPEPDLQLQAVIVAYMVNGVQTGSTALCFFVPFLGVLFMPLVFLVATVFWRREQALAHVAAFKSAAVALCLTACGDDASPAINEASGGIRKQVFLLLDNLHRYLHHKRPYARHLYLPYSASNDASAPGNEMLFHVSREMGILLRKVHLSVRDVHGAVQLMRGAGASEAHVDGLAQQAARLHTAVEQLSNVKEMRSPVMLRSAVRWLTVVIFPVFMGFFCYCLQGTIPYIADAIGLLTIHVHLALLVVTDVVTSMEDPFDDTAVDTLSLFEVLDHIAAMTTPEEADGQVAGLGASMDTAAYGAAGRESSMGRGAAYVVDPKAPPRPTASQETSGAGVAMGPEAQQAANGGGEGGQGAAGAPVAVAIAGGGAAAQQPAQVVYTVTLPSSATAATGRRQNPSLPMPPMPSNLS